MQTIAEVLKLLQQTTAAEFSGRHSTKDLILVEPFQKKRAYDLRSPLHAEGSVRFVERDPGVPFPAGRDARSKILLDHRSISRLHAVIAYTPEGWKVMDKSSNGCWLSDVRIPKEQAIELPYAAPLRLGKAVVLRVFPAADFFRYATGAPAPTGQGAASISTAPSTAETWRLSVEQIKAAAAAPTAPPPEPLAPVSAEDFDIDFDFGDGGPPQGAPTMRFSRPGSAGTSPPPPPAFPPPGGSPFPPPPPAPAFPPPAAPPPPPSSDDDFEFDFDVDGRGGF